MCDYYCAGGWGTTRKQTVPHIPRNSQNSTEVCPQAWRKQISKCYSAWGLREGVTGVSSQIWFFKYSYPLKRNKIKMSTCTQADGYIHFWSSELLQKPWINLTSDLLWCSQVWFSYSLNRVWAAPLKNLTHPFSIPCSHPFRIWVLVRGNQAKGNYEVLVTS